MHVLCNHHSSGQVEGKRVNQVPESQPNSERFSQHYRAAGVYNQDQIGVGEMWGENPRKLVSRRSMGYFKVTRSMVELLVVEGRKEAYLLGRQWWGHKMFINWAY